MQEFGDNRDQYYGQGKIWEIAARFNQESRAKNGHVTVVRRRQVEKCKRVGVR